MWGKYLTFFSNTGLICFGTKSELLSLPQQMCLLSILKNSTVEGPGSSMWEMKT